MRYLILAVACMAFTCSCSKKNNLPKDILPPDKMQEVFWDILRADIYTSNYLRRDSAYDPLKQNIQLQSRIFALHHVSKDEFYKSYTYYSNHKDLMTTMIDSMVANGAKFFRFMQTPDHPTIVWGIGVARATREEEYPRIKARIDQGFPCAIGLSQARDIGGLGNDHQVVAYGYDEANLYLTNWDREPLPWSDFRPRWSSFVSRVIQMSNRGLVASPSQSP